jgi:hypothetical protein
MLLNLVKIQLLSIAMSYKQMVEHVPLQSPVHMSHSLMQLIGLRRRGTLRLVQNRSQIQSPL